MARTIAVHSFKGGTGKSTFTANLATLLAQQGKRVAIMDMDLSGPGIHVIFKIRPEDVQFTLNDIFLSKATVLETAIDLTSRLGLNGGKLYFSPASQKVEDILKIMGSGFKLGLFKTAIVDLTAQLKLDYVLIDTHPGLENDTLLAMGACDLLIVVTRVDMQDVYGTGVILKLAESLRKKTLLVVNQIPSNVDIDQVRKVFRNLTKVFHTKLLGFIPFYDDVLENLSRSVFILQSPKHDFSQHLDGMAQRLVQEGL